MKNNIKNQLFNLSIMRNLFFVLAFSLASVSTFAQKCEGVYCVEARVSRFIVGPNCDQGDCIGITLRLDELTRYMKARVTDLGGKTIASYEMTAPKNGFGCNDELPLKLNKFKGFAFLEVTQKFKDGTFKITKKKIYIIDANELKG